MQDIDNKDVIVKTAYELLDLMEKGTTHMADEVTRIDADCYNDEKRFEVEKYGLFRTYPLVVGFSCDVAKPGDFLLHEDTDVPVLVTRNKDGEVKAFLNACRHRGVKVTEEPCGNQKKFTCPYHAWTYDSNGKLIALPGQEIFGDTNNEELGLVEFPCEERYGLIFAILTPGAHLDLDSYLGEGGAEHLPGWHFERNKLAATRDLDTKANWKLALDTFTENYHFHVLHAEDFTYKVKNCATHWRFGDNNQHYGLAWPSKSLEELRGKPVEEWGEINSHFSMLYFLFPNTVMVIYPETCSVIHVYPGDDVREQTSKLKFYARVPEPDAELEAFLEQRLEMFYKILQTEDYWVCSGAAESIGTGLFPEMVFGRNEPALAWLHEALDEAVARINHVDIPKRKYG